MTNLTINLPKKLEKQLEYLEKTTGKSKDFFFTRSFNPIFRGCGRPLYGSESKR